MASIVMLVGGVLTNTLAFTSSSCLFSRLSNGDHAREQKRHNLVIELLQKSQVERAEKWQEKINFINEQFMLERKTKATFKKTE